MKESTPPEIGKISTRNAAEHNTKTNQSEDQVFYTRSHTDQKSEIPLTIKSSTHYRISYIINYLFLTGEASSTSNYSLLSFSCSLQESGSDRNVERYETYFTANFLNKKAIELCEKSQLFNSPLPMTFLIDQNQEWRIQEIFESMLNETVKADAYSNEMMQILIYQSILFAQRLTTADFNSI